MLRAGSVNIFTHDGTCIVNSIGVELISCRDVRIGEQQIVAVEVREAAGVLLIENVSRYAPKIINRISLRATVRYRRLQDGGHPAAEEKSRWLVLRACGNNSNNVTVIVNAASIRWVARRNVDRRVGGAAQFKSMRLEAGILVVPDDLPSIIDALTPGIDRAWKINGGVGRALGAGSRDSSDCRWRTCLR